MPDEAEAWILLAAGAQSRNSRRYMLRFWYRFFAGREPSTALGAEFETYVAANVSPKMVQDVLNAVRAFCRHLIAQGTTAVYPFPTDRRSPLPADVERWLARFPNHHDRGARRMHLRHWFRFLDGREPSQALADKFAPYLTATRSKLMASNTCATVNSYLRASAADSGATPIAVARDADRRRLPAEANAWVALSTTEPRRAFLRCMLRFWYRFLAGREPTPELGAEFEAHIRAIASPSTASRALTVARVFCRHLLAQGTIAVYPFANDSRRPLPAQAQRWLSRFVSDGNRSARRRCLRAWFRFLAEREPSQALADEFAAALAATRSEAMARVVRMTVNSYLRATAADTGVTPIAVRLPARIER